MVDVKSKYVSNIFPYLGAQEKEQRGDTPLAESVVMRLTEGVRNITCDNFFTSLPLALKLQKEKISIVGTIRKNRREIAKKMTDAIKGNLHCSQFYWHKNNDMLFVKYQAKAKKTVCLLSSMHHSPFLFYLPYLSSIHEKANCIAILWTVSPHSLGSSLFRGLWVTCLPHKGGASR